MKKPVCTRSISAALLLCFVFCGHSVMAQRLPDLQVDELGFAKYVPPAQQSQYQVLSGVDMPYGEKVYLVCTFSNRGGPLNRTSYKFPARSWKIGYYVNRTLVYSQTFGDIVAGAKQVPAGWYVLAKPGTNVYSCVLDYENVVKETNRKNNSLRKEFTVERHASLAVTLHTQETGMWCWAASGQMVMHFLGHDVAQCVEANNRFGVDYCCNLSQTNSTPVTGCPKPQCVWGGWPEFDKYGFTFSRTSSTALSWDELVHQIADLKKPVAFTWAWTGGGGHVMVATGIHTVGGVNWLEVNNPWSPCVGDVQTIIYDEYVQRAGDHTHWDDFYNVTYVGGP